MLTFGSLFTGFGGMDLGFHRAGWKCSWQVEIEPYARNILDKHWPGLRRHDDARTFPPAGDWQCDLIAGGDPCQRNSGAGNSTKQSLGAEFIRIVAALRPSFVLRENPTHIRKDAPWPWWRFRSELESRGYAVLPFRLRACCFGAFHQRDRVFLLAERTDADRTGLARRETETKARITSEPARRVHAEDWFALYAPRGFGSRAGFPNYVERITGLGNAVYPDVAQWIAEGIIQSI